MKKILFLLAAALILSISCKKTVEESIDCITELMFAAIIHTANPDAPLEVTYELIYGGTHTVTITWEFGDGTSQTVVGTTVTHIYPDAGNYAVKANITLSSADMSSCSTSKEKNVDVGL